MAYKPKIATVPEGGTGVSSASAYSVVCAGTSSTSAFQTVSGTGSGSTQALTSNGAAALPTWQDIPAGSSIYVYTATSRTVQNPNDSSTYWLNSGSTVINQIRDQGTRFYVTDAQTITTVYGAFTVQGTLASSQNSTLSIRKNNTTDTTITGTLKLDATNNTFSNTGLSISLVAGDYFEIKWVSGLYATNPTSVGFSIVIKAA